MLSTVFHRAVLTTTDTCGGGRHGAKSVWWSETPQAANPSSGLKCTHFRCDHQSCVSFQQPCLLLTLLVHSCSQDVESVVQSEVWWRARGPFNKHHGRPWNQTMWCGSPLLLVVFVWIFWFSPFTSYIIHWCFCAKWVRLMFFTFGFQSWFIGCCLISSVHSPTPLRPLPAFPHELPSVPSLVSLSNDI